MRRKQLEIPLEKQVQLDLQRFAVELWNPVRRRMRHRKIARRLGGADRKQAIDGERIKRIELFAFRDESAEDRVAQIFDEKEAAVEIGSRDSGRAEPGFQAQPIRDGDKRRAFAGEMGDLAIGAAVADRRPIADGRPIHEHDDIGAAPEPGEQARRCIPPDGEALRAVPSVRIEERLDLAKARELPLPRAEARQRNPSRAAVAFDAHFEPVRRQAADRAGPLHEHRACRAHFAQADFFILARLNSIEIAVINRLPGAGIAVHELIGRARDRLLDAERRQQPLREGGLARAEIAIKRDEIHGRHERRKPARQCLQRLGSVQVPHSPTSGNRHL